MHAFFTSIALLEVPLFSCFLDAASRTSFFRLCFPAEAAHSSSSHSSSEVRAGQRCGHARATPHKPIAASSFTSPCGCNTDPHLPSVGRPPGSRHWLVVVCHGRTSSPLCNMRTCTFQLGRCLRTLLPILSCRRGRLFMGRDGSCSGCRYEQQKQQPV